MESFCGSNMEHAPYTFRDFRNSSHRLSCDGGLRFGSHAGFYSEANDTRCPAMATDPVTTRFPREDGWRCGKNLESHVHTLYSTGGEYVLFPGPWRMPGKHKKEA